MKTRVFGLVAGTLIFSIPALAGVPKDLPHPEPGSSHRFKNPMVDKYAY